MDRFTTVMAKGQIGFMNYIVMPLFECMGEYLEPMVCHCCRCATDTPLPSHRARRLPWRKRTRASGRRTKIGRRGAPASLTAYLATLPPRCQQAATPRLQRTRACFALGILLCGTPPKSLLFSRQKLDTTDGYATKLVARRRASTDLSGARNEKEEGNREKGQRDGKGGQGEGAKRTRDTQKNAAPRTRSPVPQFRLCPPPHHPPQLPPPPIPPSTPFPRACTRSMRSGIQIPIPAQAPPPPLTLLCKQCSNRKNIARKKKEKKQKNKNKTRTLTLTDATPLRTVICCPSMQWRH